MMKVFVCSVSLCLLAASASAQCLIDTPTQRGIWTRMKAENHQSYQQIVFNTTWNRYADEGRWELVRGLIDNDPALMQRSYEENRQNLQNFTATYKGNEAREMGAEHAMIYGCLKPHLTEVQRSLYEGFLRRNADAMIAGHRLGDSDANVGEYLMLAVTDVVLGTHYTAGALLDINTGKPVPVGGLDATGCDLTTLRNTLCHYVKTMAAGGKWIESSAYDSGTVYLLLQGTAWLGLEHFPEVRAFITQHAVSLMHDLTPGFKDSWQYGDDEHPHELSLSYALGNIWAITQARLDAIGEAGLAAALRQFEADAYAANKHVLNPLFARYYYWHNPFAQKADWRGLAGNIHAAEGTGHVRWRSASGKSGHVHCPAFVHGAVDHFQSFGTCDVRLFQHGQFALDHPIAYAGDPRLLNQVLVKNTGPSLEASGLTGWGFEPEQFAYVEGLSAGVTPLYWEGASVFVPTYVHGNGRRVLDLLDSPETVIVDVVQADDPTTLVAETPWGPRSFDETYVYQSQRDTIRAALGLKDVIWHTPTAPQIATDKTSYRWTAAGGRSLQMTYAYPAQPPTFTVVDERAARCGIVAASPTCVTGSVQPSELKYAVHTVPAQTRPFDVIVHCLHDASSAPCTAHESTAGEPSVAVRLSTATLVVSAKPGPTLQTSYDANQRLVFDHSKLETVAQARRFSTGTSVMVGAGRLVLADLPRETPWTVTVNGQVLPTTRHGAVLVAQAPQAGLLAISAGTAPPPPPVCTTWAIGEVSPTRIVLECR